MKRAQLALLLAAAVAAGALGLLAGSRWNPGRTPADTGVGRPAPEVVLPDLAGQPHRLDEFRGRPVLVNFWASWCAPCVEEMPMLDAFARSQGSNGTQVVGIALDDRAAVEAFLARHAVGYPVWLETPGAADASVRLGNTLGVLPFSVLIDARGRIAARKTGPFRAGEPERFGKP
jgi:thiol-disulfide isomerase/thioredoxin